MFPDWVAEAECETGRPQNVGPAGGTRVCDTKVQHLGARQRPRPGAGAFSRTSGRSFGRNARSSYDAHATGVLGTLLPFPDLRAAGDDTEETVFQQSRQSASRHSTVAQALSFQSSSPHLGFGP